MARKLRISPPVSLPASQSLEVLPPRLLVRSDLLGAALLAFAVCVVFARGLGAGFVIDDIGLITNNPYLHSGMSLSQIFSNGFWVFSETPNPMVPMYRPLITLFNYAGFLMWGESAFAFHAVALLLHAANAALVYLFLRQFVPMGAALFAAAAFALSPVRVESVTWISGVPDSFVLFFGLLALFAHRAAIERGRWWLDAVALLCLQMALWSKEVAVAIPLAILAYDVLLTRQGMRWRSFAAFAGLAGLHLAIRAAVLGPAAGFQRLSGTPFERIGDFFLGYAELLVAPLHIPFFLTTPSVPVASWLGWFCLFAIMGLYGFLWRTTPRPGRGLVLLSLVWMLIFMWPTVALAVFGKGFFTARLLYLPSVGFAIALALLFSALAPRFRVIPVAAGLLVAGYATAAVVEQADWMDNERAYLKLAHDDPAAANPHVALGTHYFARGDYAKAEASYQKAVDLRPSDRITASNAFAGLATIRGMAGNLDDSNALFQQAIAANPRNAFAWSGSGNIAWMQNRTDEAIDSYRRALVIQPSNEEARTNLNNLLRQKAAASGSAGRWELTR